MKNLDLTQLPNDCTEHTKLGVKHQQIHASLLHVFVFVFACSGFFVGQTVETLDTNSFGW